MAIMVSRTRLKVTLYITLLNVTLCYVLTQLTSLQFPDVQAKCVDVSWRH